jgi:hypothetical protein
MGIKIKWENANFTWDNNTFTWDEVQLVEEIAKIVRAGGEDEWNQWEKNKKDKLIKLILKVHGNTITESKKREIKQYKIKAKDIKIVVKEVLGAEMIAENVSF